jgi:hypothetical protein
MNFFYLSAFYDAFNCGKGSEKRDTAAQHRMESILKKIVNKYITALLKDYKSDELNVTLTKGHIHLDKAGEQGQSRSAV